MSNSSELESIVVEIAGNKPINDYLPGGGTAFFISENKIATCYHVLNPSFKDLNKVYWIKNDKWCEWEQAVPILEECKLSEDIAILKSSRSINDGIFEFRRWSGRENSSFLSRGYAFDRPRGLGATVIEGFIISNIKKYRNSRLQLKADLGTVHMGRSGSPIWSIEQNAIVGMLDYQSGKVSINAERPLAIPIEDIIPEEWISACSYGKIIGDVRSLPPHFIPRDEDLRSIKRLLLSPGANKTAITGISKRIGIHGMGGIGKSVLAAAVAHDSEIQQNFPDGIIWQSIGQNPDLRIMQSTLYRLLFKKGIFFADEQQGKTILSDELRNKKCLLILDDVWKAEHIKAFDILGVVGKILITTRNSNISTSIGAKELPLDVLQEDDAKNLLAKWADQEIKDLPITTNIIKECGNLPLAISMVGAMARGKNPKYLENILYKLKNAKLDEIEYEIDGYIHKDLFRAMEVSLDALEETGFKKLDASSRYLEFAIFPENASIPPSVLYSLWNDIGLRKDQIDDLINMFNDRSLIRLEKSGYISLHDIQLDYVRRCLSGHKTNDLIHLHNQLLKFYRTKYSKEWPYLPNDGYFPQNLAYHLIKAGREDELKKISKERRGRFFIVGIGGCGGKVTQFFLERQDSSYADKFMRLIGSKISEDIKGLWLEADKNDARNIQTFFGDIMEGYYPSYYIPHDAIENCSDVHKVILEKYGIDIKKQGFVRDYQYPKAIDEIFDSDREIQYLTAKTNNFENQDLNPIFDSAWNVIRPYTTLGGGDCDGIIFVASFGGGTGTGLLNPIIRSIRKEIKDYPIFVLGILTETDEFAGAALFSKVGRRDLAAISAIYDLLTTNNGANGVILVDNDILFSIFGNNYAYVDKYISKIMLPMVMGGDYPGQTPNNGELAQNFSGGLDRSPIFVPLFWSLPSCRNSEEELVKNALAKGRLFGCTPEKADFAVVYCRGIIEPTEISKALSNNIGLDEKKILVLPKVSAGDDEILILLRNPYGGDKEAYQEKGTFEERLCKVITSALHYIKQYPEDLFHEGRKSDPDSKINLTVLYKEALRKFFFGSDGYQESNFNKPNGFVFELMEASRRLREGEKHFIFKPMRIFSREEDEQCRKMDSRDDEFCRVFEALQEEAISVKKQAIVSGDETRLRVKQMQDKIKPVNIQLSEKSRQAIRDILNDAWNLSFLTKKLDRLADAKSYLERQELHLANNMEQLETARTVEFEERVSGWIESTKSNIFRVRSEIDELEKEIYELYMIK